MSGRTLHRHAVKHCRHFLALDALLGRAEPRQHRAISWSVVHPRGGKECLQIAMPFGLLRIRDYSNGIIPLKYVSRNVQVPANSGHYTNVSTLGAILDPWAGPTPNQRSFALSVEDRLVIQGIISSTGDDAFEADFPVGGTFSIGAGFLWPSCAEFPFSCGPDQVEGAELIVGSVTPVPAPSPLIGKLGPLMLACMALLGLVGKCRG